MLQNSLAQLEQPLVEHLRQQILLLEYQKISQPPSLYIWINMNG